MFRVLIGFCTLVVLAAAPKGAAVVQSSAGIRILTAEFGSLGAKRKLDISQRLQQLCGTEGSVCSVFCSETSFGRYSLGGKPICRVAYRCPDASTRSVEAAREEPIVLRCDEEADTDAGAGAVPQGELQPPPYVPPRS